MDVKKIFRRIFCRPRSSATMIRQGPMADDKPIDRRRFFRAGLAELLRPLTKTIAPLEQVARELGKLDAPQRVPPAATPKTWRAQPQAADRPWLRPPGALPEQHFRDACSRCGECVKVCPAQCIRLDPAGIDGGGLPFIELQTAACVLCDGLLCMQNCPSGALVPTPRADIDMGTALWNQQLCVRTAGEECTRCIEFCPVGSAAIELEDAKVQVHHAGCTGCGVCQHQCPTDPKSIVVIPKSVRGPA